MARPRKALALQTKNLTKAEIEERTYQEEHSKVNREFKLPTWLNKKAREIFKETVEMLNTIDVLDDLDVSLLAIYSDAYARVQEVTQLIDKEGYTIIKETKGSTVAVANPNLKTLKEQQKTVLDTAVKLGLTSIDRTKLVKYNPKEVEKDEFADFI